VKAVGVYMRPGWREPIMFYQFTCKLHGSVVNYPMGYAERLLCPVCMEIENKEASSEFTQNKEVLK
jgi:hypothetical protein